MQMTITCSGHEAISPESGTQCTLLPLRFRHLEAPRSHLLALFFANMAPGPGDSKYKIEYTVGGNANAKRDSLVKEGPLLVHSSHFLVKVLPDGELPSTGGVRHELSQHKLEYIFLDVMAWDFRWVLLPARVARLLSDLETAGHLDWSDCTDVDALIVRLKAAVLHLPEDDRAFDETEITADPPESPALSLLAAIKGSDLVAGDDRTAAVDFKSMLSNGYVEAERTTVGGTFDTAGILMVDAAGNDLAGKAMAVLASKVVLLMKNTQPESRELRLYRDWDDQCAEIARRSLSTKYQRFASLLETKWNSNDNAGFPMLKMAFPNACSGADLIHSTTSESGPNACVFLRPVSHLSAASHSRTCSSVKLSPTSTQAR